MGSDFALLDSRFGRSFTKKIGLYGQGNKKVDITSAASVPLSLEGGNEFVVGLSNGQIGVIARGDRRIASYFPVQKGVVNCVAVIKVKDATADEPAPVYKIVTGGVDGNIKVLDMEGQTTNEVNPYRPIPAPEGVVPATSSTYNLNDFGRGRGFRGICIDHRSNRKMLFGTCAGEIGEMEIDTGIDTNEGRGPLVVAHYRGKLNALATHPIRQEALSVGDDKVLRIWQLDEGAAGAGAGAGGFKMMNQIDLPDKATCATYSPNGHLIAIGLIKRPSDNQQTEQQQQQQQQQKTNTNKNVNTNKKSTGCAIVSYLQSILQVVHVTSDNASDVTSAAFTPDGKQFWVGDASGVVRQYDPLDNFKLISSSASVSVSVSTSEDVNNTGNCDGVVVGSTVVDGSSSSSSSSSVAVRSFDVSSDSSIVVSLYSNGKSTYWDAKATNATSSTAVGSLVRIEDQSRIRAFLSNPSYFVRSGTSGREAVGTFRCDSSFSETTSLDLSKSGGYLVTGDSFGSIRLYRSPTTCIEAPHKAYNMHSVGGVSRVLFTMGDKHVVTSGKYDRTVVVWRVVKSTSASASASAVTGSSSGSANSLPVVSYLPRGKLFQYNDAVQ